MTEINDKI